MLILFEEIAAAGKELYPTAAIRARCGIFLAWCQRWRYHARGGQHKHSFVILRVHNGEGNAWRS
jgi:hypothetical protein